jgi:hypothetical protein
MKTVTWLNPQQLAEINLKRQIEEKLKPAPGPMRWPAHVDKQLIVARNNVKAGSILKRV